MAAAQLLLLLARDPEFTPLCYAGPTSGLRVLDADCKEGTVTRMLAEGAREVVGVDLSASLLEMARSRISASNVDFLQHDLTARLTADLDVFDLTVANLVLNDIADHDGAMRDKIAHYFDSGVATVYRGLARMGVPVTYYHRTMEEYVTAVAIRHG